MVHPGLGDVWDWRESGYPLLSRWQRVYAAAGADAAGKQATARLIEALGERVVTLDVPVGRKDPAALASLPATPSFT